jgi:hypothetical protein
VRRVVMNIYEELIAGMDDLAKASEETSGVDSYLTDKVKVASISDLAGFLRIGEDTLVHKAEKDLWKISEDDKGEVVIERLFDPATKGALRI